jgi:hypothetical protein
VETSVDNHFTRQYIPEDNSEHHTRRREISQPEGTSPHLQQLVTCPYPEPVESNPHQTMQLTKKSATYITMTHSCTFGSLKFFLEKTHGLCDCREKPRDRLTGQLQLL